MKNQASLIFLLSSLMACGDKGEDDSPNVSILAAAGSVSFDGLPDNPSRTESLAIVVKGEKVVNYRYALVHDSSQCLDVEWSLPRPVSEPIADVLGRDGFKTICIVSVVVQDKDEQSVPFSYSWVKDTAAPLIRFNAPGPTGPHTDSNDALTISWRVEDGLSALQRVSASIESSEQCYDQDNLDFQRACPNLLAIPASEQGDYRLSLPKSSLVNGQTYTVRAVAEDRAGNVSDVNSTLSFLWDGEGPSPLSVLNAEAQQQTVQLGWQKVPSASKYMIVRQRNLFAPTNLVPTPPFQVGQNLSPDTTIACFTSETQCTDPDLEAFTWYYYQAFALDAAGNISSGSTRLSVQTGIKKGFRGLSRVYLASPDRRVVAEWQRFTPDGFAPTDFSYQLFASSLPSAQMQTSAVAESSGESVSYLDEGQDENLYFLAQQNHSGIKFDSNREELRLRLAPGIHHKLAASGRFLGQDPITQAFLGSAWAVAVDPYENVVFGGNPGRINVLCKENRKAFYCRGRTLEKIYTFAGRDGSDDGGDEGTDRRTGNGLPSFLRQNYRTRRRRFAAAVNKCLSIN